MAKTKAEKMRDHFRKHPEAIPKSVAEKYECADSQAYLARAAVRKEAVVEPRARRVEAKRDLVDDVKTIKEIGVDRVKTILELL